MTKIPPERLLAEVNEVLRTMPAPDSFGGSGPEHMAWLGRASALVHAWDPSKAIVRFDTFVTQMNSRAARDVENGVKGALTMLHQMRHDAKMRVSTPQSVAIDTGAVFDYFDEVRKVVELAKSDLLFVDAYMDAEFVSRYLPLASSGVGVRLLAREKLPTLIPAVALLQQQTGLNVKVRSAAGFHDRYVFVDQVLCYQSGASFKDGAKKAPTTLTEITDAFAAVLATYESLWIHGTPHP